jgi:two-component system sensor histidine kinase/response regulator
MPAPAPKTMLIVEDDVGLRESLTEMAQASGYEVRGCDTANEAIELAMSFRPTLIFCDVHLAQGDGRKVLARLREDKVMGDCQFVIMTGDWVGASESTSVAFEADAYLAKPFSLPEFLACMDARYKQANI